MAVRNYHLVIRGYGGPSEDVPGSAREFLRRLFDGVGPCPVQYRDHTRTIGDEGVLRISFQRSAHIVSASFSDCLQVFCDQFFKYDRDHAYHALSEFGKLGYASESEEMNVPWYRALFTWMQHLREEELGLLDGSIRKIKKKRNTLRGIMGSYLPNWMEAGVMAISLTGSVYFAETLPISFGVQSYSLRTPNQGVGRWASQVMSSVASDNEEGMDSSKLASEARMCTEEFMRQSDLVLNKMESNPAGRAAQTRLHSEVVQDLVALFYKGFRTVTVCRQAADAFTTATRRNLSQVMAAGVMTATTASAFRGFGSAITTIENAPIISVGGDTFLDHVSKWFGFTEHTPGQRIAMQQRDRALNSLQWQRWASGAQLGFIAMGAAWSAGWAIWSWSQDSKWGTIATLVNSAIRHGQMCESWLHLVYNTGDGASAISEEYWRALTALSRSLGMEPPTAAERNPQAIQARIIALGGPIRREKEAVDKALG